MIEEEAYVTLATNNEYANGVLVLGKSLKNTQTKRKLVVMVTSDVSLDKRVRLRMYWDELIDIEMLESNDKEHLLLLERPELGCTFSKIKAWTLVQFRKCVFLDADTLVLQNIDDLFEREELSAAPDIGWPDCFNSGVFVFQPNLHTYDKLLAHAKTFGSFDGGDQGLLNDFFDGWCHGNISRHLPFIYNMAANVSYSYAPAFKRFGLGVKVVHFLGSNKPWHHHYDQSTNKTTLMSGVNLAYSDHIFVQMWWELHNAIDSTHNTESSKSSPVDSTPSWQKWEEKRTGVENETDRQRLWETGTPDYLGEDSFDNIMRYMGNLMLQTRTGALHVSETQESRVKEKPSSTE